MARARLRTTITIALSALGVVVLAAAASLFTLTSVLDRATHSMGAAIESVRLAEGLEVDLLAFDRARDGLTRAALDGQMRRRLAAMDEFASSSGERALLERLHDRLAGYLEAPTRALDGRMPVDVLFADLEELVEVNVEQARAEEAKVKSWSLKANVAGIAVAMLLVGGLGALVLWLPRHAIRPILRIGDAMGRYGAGAREVRAPETGPEELRAMARQFNAMASTLERHRVNQLTFLAGVAHDLRSPLSALRTSAELLRRGDSLPPGQRDRVAGVVQRQTDLLERMVGDLLDAARIEAGELELRLEDCDLSRIAEEVVELHRASAATDQAATHQIVLRGADEPVMIHADPTRLAQVLTNLVGNAVKYSPDGGVITVTIATDEERVTVSVSDEGMGISEQDAGRIFEPFRRVGSGRHTLPGAGLGLSVVRRIVESHAGVVRVQSRIGAGSTFEVALPAERGAYRAPARVSDRLH